MSAQRFTKVAGTITSADGGGFTAIASTGAIDRDGEILDPGCFNPLPESIPVHLDHTMRAADVVARARPYYVGKQLMIDAVFAGTPDAQVVREKVHAGVITSVSVVFIHAVRKEVDGVVHVVSGELVAADLVSVPSNREAVVLNARGLGRRRLSARNFVADALLIQARAEIAHAKALGIGIPGPVRRAVSADVHSILNAPTNPLPKRIL